MAEKKPTKKPTRKKSEGFSAEERAAMRERAKELKAAARGADAERAVREKIAEMNQPDRLLAERVHALVTKTAPELQPRTWYGMPAYADEDGKIVCFFQAAGKFKARYATLGFNDAAKLDEGAMWPTTFAVTELTAAEEARITELVARAVGGA